MRHFLFLLLTVLLCNSCGILHPKIPQPKREFRGVWVATVVNIDWPKKGMDTAEKQKKDFLDILDFYANLNYNAVIVQVRAAGDAFYRSEFAPWSRFLTGEEGKPSAWEEDNLDWMINEAHKRGMEFHAWLNPYRATFDMNTDILSNTHDYCTNPEWMVQYGRKYYYNPGLPEVREGFINVIEEIVTEYDIDAVHFDDYFYPYKIKDLVFQDSLAFDTYGKSNQSLDDWRRSNIDSLVKEVDQTIKTIKPWVQFGISPFGVWKNNSTDPRGSDTKAGQTTYEDLYADPLLWMQEGWIDYLAPQVYWSLDLSVASHRKIVNWWAKNHNNTNLYIGNGAYKVRNNSDVAWDRKKELPDQVTLARKTPEILGNILFSAKSLMNDNPDVVSYLKRKYYKFPSLPPVPIHNTDFISKDIQLVSKNRTSNSLQLAFKGIDDKSYALFYASSKRIKSEYSMKKLIQKISVKGNSGLLQIPSDLASNRYLAITFLDRYNKESKPIVIQPKKIDQK
jgi:uncharacterized lipoprotein YddW (UPF0748 family)